MGAERQKPLPQRPLGNFTKCTFPASPSPFHSEPLGERARNVDVCTVPASQEGVGTLSQAPKGHPEKLHRIADGCLGVCWDTAANLSAASVWTLPVTATRH